MNKLTVIGGGLAGCEAAYAAANRGIEVELIEMKPAKKTAAHKSDYLAELVCSNSLKAARVDSAAGLLKEEMRRLGRISEADARSHPQKNLITRAVGVDATVEGDLFEQTLADGDILLLCSDGLTGMVEDGKIAEVLAGAGTLEDKGRELLTLALEGGGRDNITVALFTCGAKQEA